MRIYQDENGQKLSRIICNKCKKEIPLQDGIPLEDELHVRKVWGYFSKKDGTREEFDLCESCYDKLVRSFLLPPERDEITELL